MVVLLIWQIDKVEICSNSEHVIGDRPTVCQPVQRRIHSDITEIGQADVQSKVDEKKSSSQSALDPAIGLVVAERGLTSPVHTNHDLQGFRPSYCVVNSDANRLMLYFDDDHYPM